MRLQVEDLHRSYSLGGGVFGKRTDIKAVNGVSFVLESGQSVGLVGESGSGKSTLARCIMRLEKPDRGSVHLGEHDLTRLSNRELRPLRPYMQMVFQDPNGSLNPRLRIGTSVGEPLEVHKLAAGAQLEERVAELLETVGLQPDIGASYPHELSGGQLQRVAVARAIALKPEILILDEPVSAVDVSVQAQILNLLARLREQFGMSYLMISHDLAVVRQMCDRIMVMYAGEIVEDGTNEQIYTQPRHPYTRLLLDSVPGQARKRSRRPDPADRLTTGSAECPFFERCANPDRSERCEQVHPTLESGVACHFPLSAKQTAE